MGGFGYGYVWDWGGGLFDFVEIVFYLVFELLWVEIV